ncbi:MAG: class I SAM-dependent methyltransferase [Gemmatimonadetes bacterium]|nr:class I SAM-dependent methyltransferase [Gemmatimonadota bacterium]
MSVAAHLKIRLAEYDRRIRTFIPHYEELLSATAGVVALLRTRAPLIVDLGIGTAALAARCLEFAPRAWLYGIDEDPDMLAVAARRLHLKSGRHRLVSGDFARVPFPRCDALVATLALHHVHSVRDKRRLYRRCFRALRPGGVFASGDAFLSWAPALRRSEMNVWRAHLRQWYSAREARAFFAAWAREDRYLPLELEVELLESVGLRVDVPWRRAPFGVVVGWKRRYPRGLRKSNPV